MTQYCFNAGYLGCSMIKGHEQNNAFSEQLFVVI